MIEAQATSHRKTTHKTTPVRGRGPTPTPWAPPRSRASPHPSASASTASGHPVPRCSPNRRCTATTTGRRTATVSGQPFPDFHFRWRPDWLRARGCRSGPILETSRTRWACGSWPGNRRPITRRWSAPASPTVEGFITDARFWREKKIRCAPFFSGGVGVATVRQLLAAKKNFGSA